MSEFDSIFADAGTPVLLALLGDTARVVYTDPEQPAIPCSAIVSGETDERVADERGLTNVRRRTVQLPTGLVPKPRIDSLLTIDGSDYRIRSIGPRVGDLIEVVAEHATTQRHERQNLRR